MAAYLLCLTTGGGVPLFTRSKGEVKPLPFPVIGSLNGVHMFANTHGVDLLTTTTADSKLIWKVFHDSLTMILVSQDDNASDVHMNRLLDNTFQAMVLVYGLDDLTNIKNIERFKREIKVCYKIVDSLLEQSDLQTFSDVTQAVDIIAGPETVILQNFLDAFVDAANSPYGCLFVMGKVAVATKKWWELSATEQVLLAMLVNSLPKCSSRDIPVFLPDGSPKVPHRLLTFHMVQGVEVCVICGPWPPLSELEIEVARFWRPALDSLKSMTKVHPRNFPTSVTVDSSILGFILTNTSTHRCLCTVHLVEEDSRRLGKTLSTAKRKEVLRSFYKTVTGSYFCKVEPQESKKEEPKSKDQPGPSTSKEPALHQALETYVCTTTHKCYALQSGPHQIFILFNNTIPNYAMRSITNQTLNNILKEKSILV